MLAVLAQRWLAGVVIDVIVSFGIPEIKEMGERGGGGGEGGCVLVLTEILRKRQCQCLQRSVKCEQSNGRVRGGGG